MRTFIISTSLVLFLVAALSSFVYGSTLQKITRSDTKNKIQIFLVFDNVPKYSSKVTGKRIDILLDKTNIPKNLTGLTTDEKIIKSSVSKTKGQGRLTFYLRYPPQKLTPERKENMLVFDIVTGNTFTRAYSEISKQMDGVTLVDRETLDYANPYNSIPYVKDWKPFFSKYESDLAIEIDLRFTLPPFPVITMIPPGYRNNLSLLPEAAVSMASEQLWSLLQLSIQRSLAGETDVERQKMLALTNGEILLHSGDFQGAYKQLYLLAHEYEKEQVGIAASYLLALLKGIYENKYLANVELERIKGSIHPRSPMAPYFNLSRIEAALTAGQLERAEKLLKNQDVPYPESLVLLKELRYGDLLFKKNQPIRSFVTYSLIDDFKLISDHPASLANYCSSLYLQKKFRDASGCFSSLLDHVKDKEQLASINFKKTMADLKYLSRESILPDLSRIEDAFPGTDAGFRAAIKKVDILTLENDEWDINSAKYYRALAEKAITKNTSEEAAFKEALNYYLMGERTEAIKRTSTFLRNYRNGRLTDYAEALLLEMLPDEIHQLAREKKYVEMLVLAKKNRRFFDKKWLNLDLLSDVAESYTKLGLYSEAKRLYLFLTDIADDKSRGRYYLPLLSNFLVQGDYDLVEDYATQYFYNFNEGPDYENIKQIFIKALIAQKKYSQALEKLPDEIPDSPGFKKLAAEVYYLNNSPEKASQILFPMYRNKELDDVHHIFLLADSLFQTQRYDEAKPIFTRLAKDKETNQQIAYRLATIEKLTGNTEESLKLLKQIVDAEGESSWKEAARSELEFYNFNQNFDSMIDKNFR